MNVEIATSIWVTGGITLLVWLFVRFGLLLPSQRDVLEGEAENIVASGGELAVLQFFEAFLRAALLALAVLVAVAVLLDGYASSLPLTEDGLKSLVSARDIVNSLFGWAASISWWIWLGALTLLMGILGFVTSRTARSRWEDAFAARQAAIDRAIDGLDDDELDRMAKEEAPDALSQLVVTQETLQKRNQEEREAAFARPILRLQDEGQQVSYSDLVAIIAQLRGDADRLANENDDEGADASDELADVYEEQLPSIREQVGYQTESLMHTDQRTLADNDDGLYDWPKELTAMKRKALKENRLALHNDMSALRGRPEPEIWHEYATTAISSEASVKTVGWFGRNTRTIALATFFIGFFSFGASAEMPEFAENALTREVEMTLAIGDQELDAAMASNSTSSESLVDEASLASDAATEIELRRAMRSNLAKTLMRGVVSGKERTVLNALQSAGLRGLGARESLIQNAARDGAVSLEDPSGRRAKVSAEFPGRGGAAGSVDEIFDRRIAQLREKPDVWRKMRASARRPARGGLVSGQLLAATLGDNEFTRSKEFLKAADRSTAKFATSIAETGEIPRNLDAMVPQMHSPSLFSGDGQRQFADYQRKAGDRVGTRLSEVRGGRANVGSLFRSVPDINGSGYKAKKAGSYSDTFPSKNRGKRFGFAEGISNKAGRVSGRSGFSSGGGGSSGRRGPRIRRKGVVLGANPQNMEASIPLEAFEYTINGDNVSFTLKPEGARPVQLGAFDRETVHTALGFAADGRPDLASMPEMFFVQGKPVLDGMNDFASRIVLHPAIHDSDLACNALWLDRFVDITMRIDAAENGGSRLLEGWLANRELGFAEGTIDPNSNIGRHVSTCGASGDCFPVSSYENQGLSVGYYSRALSCLADGGTDCRNFPGQSANAYNMTSIVEEAPYELSADMTFLTGQGAANELWPFNFKMRAVPLARIEGDSLSLPANFTPWDFPWAQPEINRVILENFNYEPGARRIQKRMRDFTVLQRLFKTALDGRFGDKFPFEELLELQNATKAAVTPARTGNWDLYNVYSARQGQFGEHMNGMAARLVPTLQALSELGSPSCAQAASSALSAQRSRPVPRGPGLWGRIDAVMANCRSDLQDNAIQTRAAGNTPPNVDIASLTSGRGSLSNMSFSNIIDEARENDLISDAIMMGRGEFNRSFFSCPAR